MLPTLLNIFLQFLEYGENEGENRLMLRRLFDAIDVDNSGTIEKKELLTAFKELKNIPPEQLIHTRREKFIAMGTFEG